MKYVIDCISDTHTQHGHLRFPEPEGDCVWMLAHAGDYSHQGRASEIAQFATWLRQQPHPHKVVINGNHECMTDPVWRTQTVENLNYVITVGDALYSRTQQANAVRMLKEIRAVDARKAMGFAHFLQDSGAVIEGLRFYGSPYSLEFFNWGYMVKPEESAAKWAEIPVAADVLIIHGPPKWHGDRCPDYRDRSKNVFVGDEELLKRIRVVKPKLVICGHIHESAGVYVDEDSGTVIVNASVLTGDYKPYGMFHRAVLDGDTVTVTPVAVAS